MGMYLSYSNIFIRFSISLAVPEAWKKGLKKGLRTRIMCERGLQGVTQLRNVEFGMRNAKHNKLDSCLHRKPWIPDQVRNDVLYKVISEEDDFKKA